MAQILTLSVCEDNFTVMKEGNGFRVVEKAINMLIHLKYLLNELWYRIKISKDNQSKIKVELFLFQLINL